VKTGTISILDIAECLLNQQDATLSQGQPRDAPYIMSVLSY